MVKSGADNNEGLMIHPRSINTDAGRKHKMALASIYYCLLKKGDQICDNYGMSIKNAYLYQNHYITIIEAGKRSITYKQNHNEQIITKNRADFISMFAEGIVDFLCKHREREVGELYLEAERSGRLWLLIASQK